MTTGTAGKANANREGDQSIAACWPRLPCGHCAAKAAIAYSSCPSGGGVSASRYRQTRLAHELLDDERMALKQRPYRRPMLSISRCSASLSRLANGRQRNKLILRSRIMKASRKARAICSCVPVAAA